MVRDMESARLPADVFVVDAVVHALNLAPGNIASKYGQQLYDMSYGLHAMLTPPDRLAPRDLYMADMPPEALVRTIFEETQTSLAVTHSLTLDSWFHDGFAAEWKTVAMARAHPDRVLAYVGIDPSGEDPLGDLDRQLEDLPSAVGLKMYPHQMDPYRHWRMSDDLVLRLIERAAAKGLKSVALHKALPNGSVPLAPYRIGRDFEEAADAFPGMMFEIVHSGMAFVEETAMAIGRFPNVYANLETTTALLWQAPGRFAEALGLLLQWGGPEKLLWATGCTVTHPQHLLEAFWTFQLPEAVQARYGVPPLGEAVRRLVLGGNYARMIGLDVGGLLARQAGDGFGDGGRPLSPPWSAWSGSEPRALAAE